MSNMNNNSQIQSAVGIGAAAAAPTPHQLSGSAAVPSAAAAAAPPAEPPVNEDEIRASDDDANVNAEDSSDGGWDTDSTESSGSSDVRALERESLQIALELALAWSKPIVVPQCMPDHVFAGLCTVWDSALAGAQILDPALVADAVIKSAGLLWEALRLCWSTNGTKNALVWNSKSRETMDFHIARLGTDDVPFPCMPTPDATLPTSPPEQPSLIGIEGCPSDRGAAKLDYDSLAVVAAHLCDDKASLAAFSLVSKELYSIAAPLLWSTFRMRSCFLPVTYNTILAFLASPNERAIGRHVKTVIIEGLDATGLENHLHLFGSAEAAETLTILPLLPALLPNVQHLQLLDYNLPMNRLDAFFREWKGLETLAISGHDLLDNTSGLSGPTDLFSLQPFLGLDRLRLRALDFTGSDFFVRYPRSTILENFPAFPLLDYLDLSFTSAGALQVTTFLEKLPGLRYFGWGCSFQDPRPRDPLVASNIEHLCPMLEVLVVRSSYPFFHSNTSLPVGGNQAEVLGHMFDEKYRPPAKFPKLRSLSYTALGSDQVSPELWQFLAGSTQLAALEWDQYGIWFYELGRLLSDCGANLTRLVLPTLFNNYEVSYVWPYQPYLDKALEDVHHDDVYRTIAEHCPNLEQLVLDHRVRLNDPSLFLDIFEACPKVKIGFAPLPIPAGIPEVILEYWDALGRLLDHEDGSGVAMTLKEVMPAFPLLPANEDEVGG